MSEEPELLWQPTPARAARSTLTRYMRWLQDERGLQFADYAELWNWSVDELEEFWASLVEFFKVRFSEGGTTVLGERSMPGAQWFGAAVESWDPDGKPLIDDVGELVITQPMPSLPIFLPARRNRRIASPARPAASSYSGSACCARRAPGWLPQQRGFLAHRNTSKSPAAPMPPPSHIVTTTCFAGWFIDGLVNLACTR